jgi:hypothetical protein
MTSLQQPGLRTGRKGSAGLEDIDRMHPVSLLVARAVAVGSASVHVVAAVVAVAFVDAVPSGVVVVVASKTLRIVVVVASVARDRAVTNDPSLHVLLLQNTSDIYAIFTCVSTFIKPSWR